MYVCVSGVGIYPYPFISLSVDQEIGVELQLAEQLPSPLCFLLDNNYQGLPLYVLAYPSDGQQVVLLTRTCLSHRSLHFLSFKARRFYLAILEAASKLPQTRTGLVKPQFFVYYDELAQPCYGPTEVTISSEPTLVCLSHLLSAFTTTRIDVD